MSSKLSVQALDKPDANGVHHFYSIGTFNVATNPSRQEVQSFTPPADHVAILFQKGPSDEGFNGITDEALLLVLLLRAKNKQVHEHLRLALFNMQNS